jgi:hypothetical protein
MFFYFLSFWRYFFAWFSFLRFEESFFNFFSVNLVARPSWWWQAAGVYFYNFWIRIIFLIFLNQLFLKFIHRQWIFCILPFLKNREMNSSKTYFQVLALLYFCIFKKLRNELVQNLFSSSGSFESRQSGWCDWWRSRAMCTSVTHFHINIGCHVNLTGLTTPFSTQNE